MTPTIGYRPTAWHLVRATLRDWWVLLCEFGWPLLIFCPTSIAVAGLFSAHYRHADYPRGLAFDEALYGVLTITMGQPILPIPEGSSHWLITFYFLMPFLGLVLAGKGLGGFLALLFNRRARGQSWTEALASTYSSHVVVCGLGHVGSRVVDSLLRVGTAVVGIDREAHNDLAMQVSSKGVPVIQGDICQRETLRRAGVERARAVVMCTDNDLANLEAVLKSRDLNPSIRVVMRMFDAELARRVKDVLGIESAYSTSALAAPVFAAAALEADIEGTLPIGGEVFSVGRLAIHPGCRLENRTVHDIEHEFTCSIVLHTRGGQRTVHPHDEMTLAAGDQITILADFATLQTLANINRRPGRGRRSACATRAESGKD